MNKGFVIIIFVVIRYFLMYIPLVFSDALNGLKYSDYSIVQNVGQSLSLAMFVLLISFFVRIKELRQMIYILAFAELWDTIKLYCYMIGIDNIIIHDTKIWELKLGVIVIVLSSIFLILKYLGSINKIKIFIKNIFKK